MKFGFYNEGFRGFVGMHAIMHLLSLLLPLEGGKQAFVDYTTGNIPQEYLNPEFMTYFIIQPVNTLVGFIIDKTFTSKSKIKEVKTKMTRYLTAYYLREYLMFIPSFHRTYGINGEGEYISSDYTEYCIKKNDGEKYQFETYIVNNGLKAVLLMYPYFLVNIEGK